MGSAQSQTTPVPYARERRVAIKAVVQACKASQAVFKNLVGEDTQTKKDNSPVTIADYSVQAVIIAYLKKLFPDDPIVAEENAKDLRSEDAQGVREKVVQLTNSVFPTSPLSEEQVLNAIDHGVYEGGPTGRFWAIDPIDGTKGFLRGEQYAVCLALIENGEVVLGVLGCPNLPLFPSTPKENIGCLFVAVKGQGAYMRLISEATETPIKVSSVLNTKEASFCESVEAAHTSHNDSSAIAERLGVNIPPVRMDSQCKYAAIARGDATIYLRMPTSSSYEEKIWDHAAGWIIVKEAGGEVTDIHGKPLDFTVGRTLRANKGVVATNKKVHSQVIDAIQWVLFPPVQNYKVLIKRHPSNANELKEIIARECGIDSSLVTIEEITSR